MAALDQLIAEVLKRVAEQRHFPESTYRLQFHAGFTFRDAIAIIPYLHNLGITHVYASPYTKARVGSLHGYDAVDPTKLNPEIGSEQDYASFVEALKQHGMGQILDTVPNHLGVATNDNPWWNDVLENGPASRYGDLFDITWRQPDRPELRDKVLLPVLGQPYGKVLEQGQLQLKHEEGKFFIYYYDRRFPVAPQSYEKISSEQAVASLNGTPGDPSSFDALHELLEEQHYRLAYWRVASNEINYRRFFDINDLAALRMERPEVFEQFHERILGWLAEGKIAGLRIDHPDGLFDPLQYFLRLQRAYLRNIAKKICSERAELADIDWEEFDQGALDSFRNQAKEKSPANLSAWPLYVVAEKILAAGEPLPGDWAIHGTSGYDFLNMLNGLFVDGANEQLFSRLYHEWIGDATSYGDLVYRNKRRVLDASFASELRMLAGRLHEIAESNRDTRDFTLSGLTDGLREIIACFPVYRSYISQQGSSEMDARYIDLALRRAIERNPQIEPDLLHFIRKTLLSPQRESSESGASVQFAVKFQQLTAPVTAKGIEDTTFYIFNRLVSLNEVGGEPDRFGVAPEELHEYFSARQQLWPFALSCLSTHDTKRSEDARARLNVLSELPEEWRRAVARWSRLNEPHRRRIGDSLAPDSNEEYFIYQALIAVWPVDQSTTAPDVQFIPRIQQYMEKALREAKVHTSWTHVHQPFESAVRDFIARILAQDMSSAFLSEFSAFQRHIAHFGLLNSLSQTLIRLAAPGVPDTYQGTEILDFSLVDPDNRRPVDYGHRQEMLAQLRTKFEKPLEQWPAATQSLLENMHDGAAKLLITWRTLQLRSKHPGLFSASQYIPLAASGKGDKYIFSFARSGGGELAIVAAPRFFSQLTPDIAHLPLGEKVWQDTSILLPTDRQLEWVNQFTGQSITPSNGQLMAADLFSHFPVALLMAKRQ